MPKKIDKYYNERKEVFDKLLNIIGKTFYLHDLDNNIDKQGKIMELVANIKKYFICSRWTCFCKENIKREYLSIIRYVIKDMNYNMISSRANIQKEDGSFIHATLYHIIKM